MSALVSDTYQKILNPRTGRCAMNFIDRFNNIIRWKYFLVVLFMTFGMMTVSDFHTVHEAEAKSPL